MISRSFFTMNETQSIKPHSLSARSRKSSNACAYSSGDIEMTSIAGSASDCAINAACDASSSATGRKPFFSELFRSFDLAAAVDALNHAVSAPKFQFLHAESFFEMLWGMLEDMYTNPITYQQRIRESMSTALHSRSIRHSYSLPELRFEIEKFFNPAGRAAMKEHYRRIFIMLDHDPVP